MKLVLNRDKKMIKLDYSSYGDIQFPFGISQNWL